MFQKQRGFSLLQVLIATSLLGGLSLAVMQIVKNIGQYNIVAHSITDEVELSTAIKMILDDERYCRVSLAGDGQFGSPLNPVKFEKIYVDEDDEGLDIELFLSNQEGDQRSLKKFNGENNVNGVDKSKFGNLRIGSLKLFMNNGVGSNYSNSADHEDVGVIRAVIKKKVSSSHEVDKILNFDVVVKMSTGEPPDPAGRTKILSCHRLKSNEIKKTYGYPSSCSMTLGHRDGSSPFTVANLDMSRPGLVGVRLRGDVDGNDIFRIQSTCPAGNEVDAYISNCQIGFGWRDNTLAGIPTNLTPLPAQTYEVPFGETITLATSGNVNGDDSFYFRLRCPNGSDPDLNNYMKKKCQICLGCSDRYSVTPERITCKYLSDLSSASWGRLVLQNDVNEDDGIYLGFFCDGDYSPEIQTYSFP